MKKFFDRYLFSRLGLQILFSVLVILLFSLAGTLLRNWATGHSASDVYSQTFWGFRQITDGGSMAGTLDGLDEVASESRYSFGAPVVLVVALLSWLVGMVLYGFVAGAVANAFAGRKEKIDAGLVRYRFRDHGVVVGWDFQGVATVLAMLDRWKLREVVVLSESPAESIRGELANELDTKKLGRVFVCNGSLGVSDDLESLCAGRAKIVAVLGDQNETNNDGGNMRLSILLGDQIEKEIANSGRAPAEPVRMFVDVTGLHALRVARAHPKSGNKWPHVSVRVVNFFEEAVYELFSSVSRLGRKNETRVPLHFRTNRDATHAHLVVAGFDEMAQALVLHAARVLGSGSEPDRITVFSTDSDATTRFCGAFPVDRLLGVRVEFVAADVADPAQAERLAAVAKDITASVTLAVCAATPDKALETFSSLPRELRFENIRVLVEQRCLEKWTWDENALRWMGYEDVSFFGFTDRYLASVDDRDAVFRALSPEKAKDADYAEPALAPAFLETAAVCGFVPREAAGPHTFTDEELEHLASAAQNGRANGLLLDGREPGSGYAAAVARVSEKWFSRSARIRPWKDLSESDRKEHIAEWRKAVPVLDGILSSGERPLRLAHDTPALRLGALPSGRPLWIDMEGKNDFFARLVEVDKTFRTKSNTPDGVLFPAGTVLSVDPSDIESLKFAQWYDKNRVRIDVVLPAPAEDCVSSFADPDDQKDFLRLLRRAWTVTVAPGGDVPACIRARATVVANLTATPLDEKTPIV